MGRIYHYPERSIYRGWWQGWAPALFIFALVGGLTYATSLAHRGNETAANLEGQLAIDRLLLEHGKQERIRLQAEIDQLLAITPIERIIVQPCLPQRHEQKRVTPVFSRDSQFIGVQR